MSTGINESLMTAANEPSLGLYRLQEHVIGTVPKLVRERQSVESVKERLKGVNFDMEYDMEAIKCIGKIKSFDNISSELQKAIDIKKLLNQREAEKRLKAAQGPPPPPPARSSYGATGESPPLLRRGEHVINASPLTQHTKGSNIDIAPKQF